MSLRSIHCSHYRCAQIAITPCYALRIIHCVHSLLVAALLFVLLRCFATLIRSCLFATLTCRTLVLHVRSNCIATLLSYAHPLLLVRSFALTIVLRTQVFALVNRCALLIAVSSLRSSCCINTRSCLAQHSCGCSLCSLTTLVCLRFA
jgi:hypothetical protein